MEKEYAKIVLGKPLKKMFCPNCSKETKVLELTHLDEFYCTNCNQTFSKEEKLESMDKIYNKLFE